MRPFSQRSVVVLLSGSLLAYSLTIAASASAQGAQHSSLRPRIVGPIDESSLLTLRGNTHPLALPKFDQGPAPVSMPANRLLLILSRSTQQEAELQSYLQSVQDANSPNYRKFMSPDEFGKAFGVNDTDLQTIQSWLAGHGFTVSKVGKGRMAIEVSGTVGQLQSAFHTSLHSYVINGEQHWANASDPQIPSALAPVVAGFASLNSFRPRAHYIVGPRGMMDAQKNIVVPAYTNTDAYGDYYIYLSPADAATIYNTPTTLNANLSGAAYDGTGVTIGVAGDSNINLTENAGYRSAFGLPPNPTTVVVDGNDPGENQDAIEAYLDTQVSGGIAPGANVILYTAADTSLQEGLNLAIQRAVDDNQVDILNVSFGECEQALGASGNQFILNMWEQAAAQGISVTVSSGDSGSAGCDDENSETAATQGLAVNGYGSTPYNVSVGGTDFDILYSNFPGSFKMYVDVTNTLPNHRSALGYIPEEPWNDSTYPNTDISGNKPLSATSGMASDNNIIAGGGGISSLYPVPSWQVGFASGNGRNVADVSLLAGNGFYGALWSVCTEYPPPGYSDCISGQTTGDLYLTGVGGTSASAPAFAGMLALVKQKIGSRLGQADYGLYDLAGTKYSTVFHDVTSGDNSVDCTSGSPGCSEDSDSYYFMTGYNAATGYDLATGLGSVNAGQLVQSWPSPSLISTTSSLQLNGAASPISITHGQSIAVGASVTSSDGTPTGLISLVDSLSPANRPNSEGISVFTLASGSVSGTTNDLPGGTYQVSAHYGGSSTFAASDSNGISVNVAPESSTTLITKINAFTQNQSVDTSTPHFLDTFVIDAMPYGNSESAANPNGVATGTVTFMDGSTTLGTAPLNSAGTAELSTDLMLGGNNNLTASYSGDASFKANTSAPFPYSVATAPTSVILSVIGQLTAGVSLTVVPTLQPAEWNGGPPAPTGTMTIYNGTTALGSQPVSSTIFINLGQLPIGTYSLTAQYSGDSNYAPSSSPPQPFTIKPFIPAVTVVPSQSPLPVNHAVNISVTIAGSSGMSPATGSVVISSPSYPTQTALLVGGVATITIPANSLPIGLANFTATYAGDNIYYGAATGTGSLQVDSTGTLTSTVTVIPAQSNITSYPVQITVTITGPSGSPIPTGVVTLTTPEAVTSGQTLVQGKATFSLPYSDFETYFNGITASYYGDSNYAASSGQSSVNIPVLVNPTMTASPLTVTSYADQPISVTITLTGPAGVEVPTGTVLVVQPPEGIGYVSATSNLVNGSAVVTIPANSLPIGQTFLEAIYSGDPFYTVGVVPLTYTVNLAAPTMTVTGTSVTVAAGAGTGNTSTITVTPGGGLDGSVSLSAMIASSPSGAQYLPTFSFGTTSPLNITGTNAGTATLTITTLAPNSATLVYPKKPGVFRYAAEASALACIVLFCLPRRRNWQRMLGMLFLLVGLTGGVFACGSGVNSNGGNGGGGGSGGGGGGTSSQGTTPGTYTITVSAISGTTSGIGTVTLTVQ